MDEPDLTAQIDFLPKLLRYIASQDWVSMKEFIDTNLNHTYSSIVVFDTTDRRLRGVIGDCVGHLQAIQDLVMNNIDVNKISS